MVDNRVYINPNGTVDEIKTSDRAIYATIVELVISPEYNANITMIDISKLEFVSRCKFAENPNDDNPIKVWFNVDDNVKIDIRKNYTLNISQYDIKCTAGVIKYGYSDGCNCCWREQTPVGYYIKAKRNTHGFLYMYDLPSPELQFSTCEIEHVICDETSKIEGIDYRADNGDYEATDVNDVIV